MTAIAAVVVDVVVTQCRHTLARRAGILALPCRRLMAVRLEVIPNFACGGIVKRPAS